jgi:hypothetical protein
MSVKGCWRKPRIARKLIGGALATFEDLPVFTERIDDLAQIKSKL